MITNKQNNNSIELERHQIVNINDGIGDRKDLEHTSNEVQLMAVYHRIVGACG